MRGGEARRPFGIFTKIRPIWRSHPSLRAMRIQPNKQKEHKIQRTKYKTQNNDTENKIRSHRPAAESWGQVRPCLLARLSRAGNKNGKTSSFRNTDRRAWRYTNREVHKYRNTRNRNLIIENTHEHWSENGLHAANQAIHCPQR